MGEVVIHPSGATVSADRFRIRELGELLHACRDRQPSAPAVDGAHRAPGLTQQEAAALLSVSERHYRDFERGRLRRPEPAFLDQVARVLSMSLAEREVLYHLASGRAPLRRVTRANLQAMQEWIDTLPGQPALVTDLAWNILLWNEATVILDELSALPPQERNAVLWMFGPTARARFVEVEAEYPALVGRVRTAYLCAQGLDPGLTRLAERLQAIPEAAAWWRRGVLHAESVIHTRRLRRPDGTARPLHSISTTIPHQDLRLIVFSPVGTPPRTEPLP